MKKIASLGLFLFLSFFTTVLGFATEMTPAVEDIFEDMDGEHENADAILLLYELGVIEGYQNEDGTREYRPDQEVNRAEFLKILLGGEIGELETPSEDCFPDVPADEWFAPYVCTAKEEGWIEGYPDGFFRPEQTINKVESLKVLGEATEWEVDQVADGEQWYQSYLEIAEDLNIVTVEENDALMTRGDTAETIFRHLQVVMLSVEAYVESQNEELFEYYGFSYTTPKDSSVYGSISHSGSTVVGETVTVTVDLFDSSEEAVSGHSLMAMVTTPHTYKTFELEEEDMGTYVFELSSFTAATYGVYVRDEDTGEIYDTVVYFEADDPETIDILNVVQPYENEDHTGTFDVVQRDQYGNVVEIDSSYLDFSSTLGEISTDYADGAMSVSLSSESPGEATVNIEGEEVNFYFDSVMLGVPRGVEEEESFSVPVYVNMGSEGSLAEYDISIVYNSGYLQFEGAAAGSDDFMGTPTVGLSDGTIQINGVTTTGEETGQYVHVADLLFSGAVVGDGTIYAEDATITNTNETSVENPLLQQAAAPSAVVVKPTKKVCLDVFVLEPADAVTEVEVRTDMAIVETAIDLAAETCLCSHFVDFELNYTSVPLEEWQFVTTGTGTDMGAEDQVTEEDEMDELADVYGDEDCVPVFYTPMLNIDDALVRDKFLIGWSQAGGASRHIVIDHSRDDDSLTLLHELLHMLSGNAVADFDPNGTPEENAQGVAQGASDPGNAMNYGDTGTGISAAQCALIDWADWPTK